MKEKRRKEKNRRIKRENGKNSVSAYTDLDDDFWTGNSNRY